MYLQKPVYLLALALSALSAFGLPIDPNPGTQLNPRVHVTQPAGWFASRWRRSTDRHPVKDANEGVFPHSKPFWEFPPPERSIDIDAREQENIDLENTGGWRFPPAKRAESKDNHDYKDDSNHDSSMAGWGGWW